MSVLPSPPPLRPSLLRLAPAELAVLDRVHVFGDLQHLLDEVGDAVAVAVGEVGRVDALGDPVDAEVRARRRASAAPPGPCRRCGWDRDRRSAAAGLRSAAAAAR